MRALRVLGIITLALMISSAVAGSALGSKNHELVSPSTPASGQLFDYVLNIMLENHSINFTYYNGGSTNSCIGNCTYFTALANANALAEGLNLGNIQSPSAGAYIAITSAYRNTPQNCNNGPNTSGCPYFQISNIVDSLDKAGLSWKAYMEGYPQASGCVDNWFDTGPNYYAPIHNPFVYYSDIHNNSTRCNRIVNANSVDINQNACWPTALPTDDLLLKDLNSVTNASNYMFLTPNLIDDAHNCNDVSAGNAWLQKIVPQILSSTLFKTKRAALFVTFDEPGCTDPSGQPPCPSGASSDLYSVWASNPSNPTTKIGFKSIQPYTLYSPLKAVESSWNLASFNTNDGTASNMAEFFGSPLKASFSHSPSSPQVGQTVTFTASPTGGVSPYGLSWTFGDGGTSTSSPATHSYTTAGSYTVKLTVTDNIGTKSSATQALRVGPDFNISSIPPSLNVQLGSSNTTTINLASINSFSGTITLSTSVAPPGLTATLNPNSVSLSSGGTGSSTLTVSSSTAGNYAVNMTGTSGSISHSTIVTVNVAAPDFSVSSSVSSLTIQSSNSGSSTITVNSIHQFSGTVLLSASVSPAGLNASLIPTTLTIPASGSSTSTLVVSSVSTSPIGAYNITITGTSGTLSHQTIVAVTLVPPSLTVASDGALGTSSLYTAGGQKLIQDSAGRMIAVYVDSSGRIGLSYANTDPTVGGWSTPIKSSTPSSAYAWPAAVLVSLSSLRIIAGGGSNSGLITDVPVTILRDSQNNITGFTFGAATALDSSGLDRYPAAILAHNGDILAAWAWQNATRTLVKFLRWDPSTGWKNTAGTSTTPDILLNSVDVTWFVPAMIERPDNHNVYLLANRFTGPPSTIAFVKATWNGSTWSWGAQNLTYETNASDSDDDPVSLVWDPTRSLVVAQYGITSTHTYGVFTLSATDVKIHIDTPNLTVAADRGWAGINVQTQTGDYYIFLISVSSDGGPGPLGFIRMPAGGSWNATIIWLNTATDNEVTSLRTTGPNPSLDLLYVEGTTAPTLIKFVRVNPPNFSVTANPGTLTVQAGSNAASTLTVSSLYGFNGTVNLSGISSPSGLVFSLSPATVTLTRAATATSILTFSPTANGTYTITVTGTSGPFSETTTVVVSVTDFIIMASPTAVTVAAHAPGNSTIAMTALNGFTGLVSLGTNSTSCAVSPLTVTGSGSANLSCNFSSGRIVHLVITGTSGFLTHNATVTYTVQDFTITSSPTIVNVNLGTGGISTITVTGMFGYSGLANLSTNSTACTVSPGTITGSGNVRLSCTFTSAGTVHVVITGTSGLLAHTAVVTYIVQDFSIAATPPTIMVNAGSAGTSTVTVTSLNGFAGLVNLSTNSTSCTVSPNSLTGSGSATFSCTFSSSQKLDVRITGRSGTLVHTADIVYTVQDFTVTASPTSANVNVNASGTSTITVAGLNGFAGIVNLVTNNTSACTLSPTSVTGSGSATLSCTFTSTGNKNVSVTGGSGSLSHSATMTFVVQDFTISANPTSITVNAGTTATSTITVTPINGFAGGVSLGTNSTSCSVSPNTVTGSGNSTLSCTFASAGRFDVGVTGTSASLSHSVSVMYIVQDFTVTATSPAAVNVGQAATSTTSVGAVNGFAGTVSFSITPSSGLSCGLFTPPSVTGSGSATVSCSATSAGNYTATITGASTQLIHNATATFQFRDFTITATSPASANAGTSATSTITVAALNGFAGTISFNDSAPAGLACGTITPTSVAGSGTATVSCTSIVAGNYTLTVTGASGSLVHNATVLFQFCDFGILASSPSPTDAGSSAVSTIMITSLNGFAGTVNLIDLVPSGLTCGTINPTSINGSGTATVSCIASIAGNYTLTVTGTSGSLNHSTTLMFIVQDFNMSATSPAAVNAGISANSTITVIAMNNFAGVVNLSDNIPIGLTCATISPSSVTGAGNAAVSCSSNVAGNYTLTLTGTSGALSHSVTIVFTVQDYTITATVASVVINTGSSGSSAITITALNHFSGTVALSASSTTGLTSAIYPTSLSGGSGTATLTFSSSTAGNYTATIISSSSTLTHTITVMVQVVDFAITANPSTITILAGATGNSIVTVTALNGFSGTVNLILGHSNGLTATIAPHSIAGSGTSTITASASTSGDYSITIEATSGPMVHTIGIVIQVQDYGLTGSPTNIVAPIASNATSRLTLQSLNGYAGNVSLTASVQINSGLTPTSGGGGRGRVLTMAPPAILPIISINPQSLQLFSGGTQQSTISISLPSNLAAGNYQITVTASDGTLSHAIILTVVATDFNITATPTSTSNQPGSNSTIVLNLQSLNLFQGNITLTVASTVGGPTGTLSTSTLQLTPQSSVNLNLTISVPSNTSPGNYTITVQVVSGTISHTLIIPVTVTTSGFVTVLAGILGPHNSNSISVVTIFTLFTIFATPKIREYSKQKPTLHRQRRIKNRDIRGPATCRLLLYSPILPPFWSAVPRDEY